MRIRLNTRPAEISLNVRWILEWINMMIRLNTKLEEITLNGRWILDRYDDRYD